MRMVAGLVCFLVVGLRALHVFCEHAEPPNAMDLVADFTEYSMYFKEISSSRQCLPGDILNLTHLAFTKSIDRCPDKHYSPRFLTTSQISWKISPKKSDLEGKSESNSTDEAFPPRNSTSSNGTSDNVIEEKKNREIIHKYLAFALLLPKHPFSTDLHESLVSAGPMFPSVTIVSGNGYDFTDMCRQYAVRSFPQLFFFKDGLLAGTYDGAHNIPEVASRLSKWTNSLPKALPNFSKSSQSQPTSVTYKPYSYSAYPLEREYFGGPESVLFSFSLFGRIITARVPYVTEPIVGSMEHLAQYEALIFISAGCFALGRFIYYLARKHTTTISI